MARSRNIKPGFFKNEQLVELPYEYRLLFIALWTIADREGRIEDRPKKIKMECFPADSLDVTDGLEKLTEGGFIERYVQDKVAVIQITKFKKHQQPHIKEQASTLPARCMHQTSDASCNEESTVQAPEEAGTSQASSLIPSSLIPSVGGSASADPPKPEARGTRLPADWTLTAQLLEEGSQARAEAGLPEINLQLEASKFADYWRGQPGAKGRKLDWTATWRNWCRSAFASKANGSVPRGTSSDGIQTASASDLGL